MKRMLLFAVLGFFVVLISCTHVQSTKDAPRITKEELKAKMGSPDLVLLDVRAEGDWEGSHEKILGAVRMNPDAVDTWAETLPKGKKIVLYCA